MCGGVAATLAGFQEWGEKHRPPFILSNLLFFLLGGGRYRWTRARHPNWSVGGASTLYYHFAYFYTLAELYTLYDYLL